MNDSILNILINAKDQASAVMQGVESQMAALNTTSQKLRKQGLDIANQGFENVVNWAKQAALAVGVAGVAIVGIGLTTATSFEAQISNIKALTGATASQVTQIQALAMKLGKETKYSALESAQGIEELLKAGLTLEQVMKGGVAGALDLAAAGGIAVKDAAEIASTALNAFSRDNLTVADAANILAGAANASATDIMELKFGLSQVSSVASAVGMSFKDTNTALAIFAQNGLKGSDAGTSLKTMLLNLQPQTKAQKALFDQLGITTKGLNNQFFDSNGQIQSLASISDILKSKLGGLTDQQRIQALETLFGSDAIRASNILYKEGAEGIDTMARAMENFTAADVAKERMNNFNGALDNFKSTIETVFIQVFLPLMPQITAMIQSFTESLNGLDTTQITASLTNFLNIIVAIFTWFINNGQLVAGILVVMTGAFIGLSVGLALYNAAAWAGVAAGTPLIASLYGIATATWVAMAPLLPFIAVGAAIAAMLYLLKVAYDTNFMGIQDTLNNFWNWSMTNSVGFWSWLVEGTANSMSNLLTVADTGYNIWKQVSAEFWFFMADIFRGNMTAIADRLNRWGFILRSIFNEAFASINRTVEEALVALGRGVSRKFVDIVNNIGEAVNSVINKINEVLNSPAAQKILGAFGGGGTISTFQKMSYKMETTGGTRDSATDIAMGGKSKVTKSWNEQIADIFDGFGRDALKQSSKSTENLTKNLASVQDFKNKFTITETVKASAETAKEAAMPVIDLQKESAKAVEDIRKASENQPKPIMPKAQKGAGASVKEESQAEKDLKVLKAQLDIMKDQASQDIEKLQRQKELSQFEEAKLKLTQANLVLDTVKSDLVEKQLKDLEAQRLVASQLDPIDKAGRQAKDDQLESLQNLLVAKREELSLAKEQERTDQQKVQGDRDAIQKQTDLSQLEIDRQIQLRKDRLDNDTRAINQKISSITINVQTLPNQSNEDIAQQVARIIGQQINQTA